MEKLPIKLFDLSKFVNVIIEKIQQLDASKFTNQQKLEFTKEMIEGVNNFRTFFGKNIGSDNDESIKSFKEKLEIAFSQFEWNTNVAITPLEFQKFSESGKVFISSILKLLGIKGCGILIIDTYLNLCIKLTTETINTCDNVDLSINKSKFKILLQGFSAAANALKKYWHISLTVNQKSTIMLCLHQICKGLPLVLKMIELQNVEVKKYALQLLKKCLSRIQTEIYSEENSKNSGQEFITLMDFCLYKLNELSNYSKDYFSFIEKANATVESLRPIIDEILCLVMSIAQVTVFQDDYSAILSASQKVLKELSDLTEEIKVENVYAIKLNSSSVGESLCNLEYQVNTAVLKLVLEVFSEVNSPLKNILNRCRTDITKDNKSSEDLKVLISEFDSEMDRIMQIGFFAISCTTSLNRILGIQSCLASLESLETELIPSLTTLYIDCTSENKSNFQYLFDFWLNEITVLKTLIDSILDPAGFCGVVKNKVKSLGLTFKEDFSSEVCLNKLMYGLKQAVRYSRKLIRTLKTSLKDENESSKETEKYFRKFQLAVQECEAVLDLMDKEKDTDKTIQQAVKRYDFLMETLEKLSTHLFYLVTPDDEETEISKDLIISPDLQVPKKNYYKLYEPAEVTLTPSNVIPEVLTPYVNTGILRSKRRNVLYTTTEIDEHKNEYNGTILQTRYWDKTPVSSKRSRCCKPLTLNLELENSLDLEITTILENVSYLNSTFCKTTQSETQEQKNESKKSFKDVGCGMEKGVDDIKCKYTSSGCCAKLESEEREEDEQAFLGVKFRKNFLQRLNDLSVNDTLVVESDVEATNSIDSPDRINDIRVVEEKINFLKNRMPCVLP